MGLDFQFVRLTKRPLKGAHKADVILKGHFHSAHGRHLDGASVDDDDLTLSAFASGDIRETTVYQSQPPSGAGDFL